MKITPAHDFNDFEVGKRHKLAMINIFDAEARLTLQGNSAFLDGVAASAELDEALGLHGDDRFLARARVVALMAAAGLLAKVEPHGHMVPHGDRSNVAIEPWLTDQWYVDAKTLAQPALKAVREARRASCRRTGRRPISIGWRTSSHGACRGSSGGDTRFRLGTGRWPATASSRTKTERGCVR